MLPQLDDLVDVDLTLELECEGSLHGVNWVMNHRPGPATHFMRSVCGFGDGLRCAAYVRAARKDGVFCWTCGRVESPSELTFIEL